MLKQFYTLMAAFQHYSSKQPINTSVSSNKAVLPQNTLGQLSGSQEGFLSESLPVNSIPGDGFDQDTGLAAQESPSVDENGIEQLYVDEYAHSYYGEDMLAKRVLQSGGSRMASPDTPFNFNKIGLTLANKLADVEDSCRWKTCALNLQKQKTQSIQTMQHEMSDLWTFYSLEEQHGPVLNDGKIVWETNIMMTKTMRETQGGTNEYGAGLGYIHDTDDILIQKDAIKPSIWYVGDRKNEPILIAFEKLDSVNGNSVQIVQYSNEDFFRMNIYQDVITLPKNLGSVSDGNPTITGLKFSGNI